MDKSDTLTGRLSFFAVRTVIEFPYWILSIRIGGMGFIGAFAKI